MSFEVSGSLHKKFETEKKSDTFQVRQFALEIQDGNYPQYVGFQLTQDRCGLLDSFEEGDPMLVHFDLRGREWNGRFITNLNAWRLEKPQASAPSQTAPPAPTEDAFPSASDAPVDDDLPF